MSPSWLQHKMLSHPMIPYHCSLRISTQETKPLLFHNNWFFFYFQQNPVISKYRPRGTNTARVKSNIGVLWYGDQFFCWVKRFININHGTFAYVTHRHNLSWENWEQNRCNSSMCRFLITRSKMAMAVTWARTVYLAGSQTTKAYC